MKKKILFICGSENQVTQMHQVADHLLSDYDCWFSPAYADGWLRWMAERELVNYTIIGTPYIDYNLSYFREHGWQADYRGEKNDYDLVISSQDLMVPKNIRGKQMIVVQEGLTVPETWRYHVVRALNWNPVLANTAMLGLSDAYTYFCVAGNGYRNFFERKGVDPMKIRVTGIPNFDDLDKFRNNDFPHRDYVLAATSRLRETLQPEDRDAFIRQALNIADGGQLIFKLHPKENHGRAIREIRERAPDALICESGSTEEMIANCRAMFTKYSTVILTALGLNKTVYSDYDPEELRYFKPWQNGGTSGRRIAELACELLDG